MIQCGAEGVHRIDECVVGSNTPVPRFAENVVPLRQRLVGAGNADAVRYGADDSGSTIAAVLELCDHDETFAGTVNFVDFDAPAGIGCVEADGDVMLLLNTDRLRFLWCVK